MITVFVRTFIIYLFLIVSIRLMGKRQIGELQVTEFIVTFMLSELATIPIIDRNAPFVYSLIPILLLLSLEVILSFIMSKAPGAKRLMYGSPGILIIRGRVMQDELARNRIDIHELLAELRLKGISDISDVEYAIMEDNGKVSVIKKATSDSVTPEILSLNPAETGLAHAIIVNGKVSTTGLRLAGKNESWLERRLQDDGAAADEIFLMTVDDSGSVNTIRKDKNK